MRGDGGIEQRHGRSCPNYSKDERAVECACPFRIVYYADGKRVREAGQSGRPLRTEEAAKRLLRKRLGELSGGRFIGPAEEKIRVGDLLDSLAQHLALVGKDSAQNLSSVKIVKAHFGDLRAVRMSATVIERFQAEELAAEDPPAVATINRYVGVVRQAFRLAHKQGRLSRVPYFPMLPIDNARSGFLEPANLARLLEKLPPHLADATEFAYLTGWRKGHISKLEWEHVDRTNRLLAVPGRLIKNRRPQTIPLAGRLWEVIERRWERREVKRKDGTSFLSPHVFHRGDGKRLGEIRKTWARACREAGFAERVRPGKRTLPGLLFHDLRRSAARNLVRSGVDRNVAKKITGHKTDSMFDRYNITDTRDQEIAFERLEAHLAAAPKKTNVVPIK